MKWTALGCVLLAGLVAAAQDEPRVMEKPLTKEESKFVALDKNSDRKLSEIEFRADPTLRLEFAALDTDHDGFLSMSEFVSRPIPPAKTSP